MTDLSQYFDKEAVPEDEFQPLAPGWYRCMVATSGVDEKLDNGGNKSVVMTLSWVVTAGDKEGRTFKDRFALATQVPTEGAATNVRISQQRLKGLCDVLGVPGRSSEEFEGAECELEIAIQKNNPKYNECKGYRPVSVPARPAFAKPQPTQAAPVSNKPRPGFLSKVKPVDDVPFDH